MLSSKFYSQISVCPACHGWGTRSGTAAGHGVLCTECSGEGVALFQSQKTFSWTAPAYVDFKGRTRQLVLKTVLISLPFIGLVMLLLMLKAFIASIQ